MKISVKHFSLDVNRLSFKKILFFIIFIYISLYGKTLFYEMTWDDPCLSTDHFLYQQNISFKEFFNIKYFYQDMGWFRPLHSFLFFIDYKIHNFNVFIMHLESLFYGLLLVISAFLLLKTIYNDRLKVLVSLLLFILLPVHAETIAFISGRDSLLANISIIFSLYLLIKSINSEKRFKVCSLLAGLVIFSGLLMKENSITSLIIFLGYCCLFRDKISVKRVFLVLLPSFVLCVLFLYIRFKSNVAPPQGQQVLFSGLGMKFFLTIPLLLIDYIKVIVFPIDINIYYPFPVVPEIKDIAFFVPLFVILFLVFLNLKFGNRVSKFGMFYFVVALLPFSHIFNIHNYITNRWASNIALGLILVFTESVFLFGKKKSLLVFCVISAFYCAFAFKQVCLWKNNFRLFGYAVEKCPEYSSGHFNLGNYYFVRGNNDKAKECYMKTINLNREYVPALTNLGYVFFIEGDYESAKHYFEESLKIADSSYARRGMKMIEDKIS